MIPPIKLLFIFVAVFTRFVYASTHNIAPIATAIFPINGRAENSFARGAYVLNMAKKKYEVICGIYLITNPNGRQYVGQAVDIISRWKDYKAVSEDKEGEVKQPLIDRSLKKYGFDAHKFEIIQVCHWTMLSHYEMYYIYFLDTLSPNGMNLRDGGSFGRLSQESKDKLSKALMGNTNFANKKKLPVKLFTVRRDGTIFGVIKSRNPDIHELVEVKSPKLKIDQFDKFGKFIKTWDSSIQIKVELGFSDTSIRAVCYGKNKTAHGFVWRLHKETNGMDITFEEASNEFKVRVRTKIINQFDAKTGIFVRQWISTMAIDKELGFSCSNISASCKGKYKTFYGFVWRYGALGVIPNNLTNDELKTILSNNRGIAIIQYDAHTGVVIKRWDNMARIEEELGYSKSLICLACKNKIKSAYGFIWRYYRYNSPAMLPQEYINNNPLKFSKNRSILQYSYFDGKLIKVWDNSSEIQSNLGYKPSQIIEVCNGKNKKTAFGFIWIFADEHKAIDLTKEELKLRKRKTNGKPIIQKMLDGDELICWESISQIHKGLKYSEAKIINACKNDEPAYGYRWSYKNIAA